MIPEYLISSFLFFIIFSSSYIIHIAAWLVPSSDIKMNSENFPSSKVSKSDASNVFKRENHFINQRKINLQLYQSDLNKILLSSFDAKSGQHFPYIILSYDYEGERILIDLQLNQELLPEQHFLKYQDRKSSTGFVVKNFTIDNVEHCHYQGSIRNKPLSRVAVSTCNENISGIVFDGKDTFYIYSEKNNSRSKNFIIRQSEADLKNQEWETTAVYERLGLNSLNSSTFNSRRKRRSAEDVFPRDPYNVDEYTFYLELVIVVDQSMYQSYNGDVRKIHQYCKDLANIINAVYVPLNIYVALIGVVIWSEYDEIQVSEIGITTLQRFLEYRRSKLFIEHPNDHAQLLTKREFLDRIVGKALLGPICTYQYSGAVCVDHSPIPGVVATTMAHEMGHNFGMDHDSDDCKCPSAKCIMSPSSTSVVPLHWSDCSLVELNRAFSRGMNYCLRNKPKKLFGRPQCGNGFVEAGEECDCGLPDFCQSTCCDPQTCKLRPHAVCATGKCCDLTTCHLKSSGTMCRNVKSECDLPEFCTGDSEYCPTDVFVRDTTECDNGKAYCLQGECRSHDSQCRVLWGVTGKSFKPCYSRNTMGKSVGNCGFDRPTQTFTPCTPENVECGFLQCHHLNERLEFGNELASDHSKSFTLVNNSGVSCSTASIDLGLQDPDPGLTPNGAKCGDKKMCIDQKCVSIGQLQKSGIGKSCPENCNKNGVCNSQGHCHCDLGFSGSTCLLPGPGGSEDSGPATNTNPVDTFKRFNLIFFCTVLPFAAILFVTIIYCLNVNNFKNTKRKLLRKPTKNNRVEIESPAVQFLSGEEIKESTAQPLMVEESHTSLENVVNPPELSASDNCLLQAMDALESTKSKSYDELRSNSSMLANRKMKQQFLTPTVTKKFNGEPRKFGSVSKLSISDIKLHSTTNPMLQEYVQKYVNDK